MIRFDNVSKIYSTDVVLKKICWEIKKGDKVGLVGSNGAGKSTQFKILIGEEDQTSGSVIKEGNPKNCPFETRIWLQAESISERGVRKFFWRYTKGFP